MGVKRKLVTIDGETYEEHETEIEDDKTGRGFRTSSFIDLYGAECSMQQSSLATEAAIWFGIDNPKVSYQTLNGKGWKEIDVTKDNLLEMNDEATTILNSGRMHLTQSMVKQLLPYLQHFAETGDLPAEMRSEDE